MSKKDLKETIGKAFEDLDIEEMASTQGAGDTEAETFLKDFGEKVGRWISNLFN